MKNQLKDLQQMMKDRSRQMADSYTLLIDKIGAWLDKIEKSKASNDDKILLKKELNDLGKFIVSSGREMTIAQADFKSPKFIVERNKKKIGVELFDLNSVNHSKKHEATLKTIFEKVESQLLEEESNWKGVYDIVFKEDVDISESKEEISDVLIQLIKSGEKFSDNNFIESIDKTVGETVYLQEKVSEEGLTLLRSEVEDVITLNEKQFEKNSKHSSSQWLIIVLGGVQDISDYAFLENDIMAQEYKSSFDKVFLFDSFSEDIIELK